MDVDDLRTRMDNIKSVIARSVEVMPDHMRFIADHCRATAP
jgi:tryptophan halogenase